MSYIIQAITKYFRAGRLRELQSYAQAFDDKATTCAFVHNMVERSRYLPYFSLVTEAVPMQHKGSRRNATHYDVCDVALVEADSSGYKTFFVMILCDKDENVVRNSADRLCQWMRDYDCFYGVCMSPNIALYYKDNGGEGLDQLGDESDLLAKDALENFIEFIESVMKEVNPW